MRMVISAEPKVLQVVRGVVRYYAREAGLPEHDVDCLALAVDEATSNVIRHTYAQRPEDKITLEILNHPDRIEVVIEDRGPKVCPEAIRSRPLGEVRPGGLGTFFIKCLTDSSTYDDSFTDGNRLRLVKRIKGGVKNQ